MNAKRFVNKVSKASMDASHDVSPRKKLDRIRGGRLGIKTFSEDNAALKETDVESKPALAPFIHNSEKTMQNSEDAQVCQRRQKSKLFRGNKKLSRNMWTSMDQEKVARKNRVLKSEKSVDDPTFMFGKKIEDRGTHFDVLPEDVCVESFTDKPRRGSICEEIEKEIFQDGISLYEMRKAMVVEETLKDRFFM